MQEAMAQPADSQAHQLAQTLIAQQETALVEQGLELGSQYQISHAEQAKLATETANNAVSDQSLGELVRLVNTENGSKADSNLMMGHEQFWEKPGTHVKGLPENGIENSEEDVKMISGATSGARNPVGNKAKEHAEKYYDLVRSMKTDVAKIAKTTGLKESEIQSIKDFIFFETHDLGGPCPERFSPDYMMAETWRRLIAGTPEKHDLTLIYHETLERNMMASGMTQHDAHILATQEHNYAKEASEYYAKIKKYKKE